MAVTERPHGYCFTKNDIRYGFTVTNLTRPGLMVEVKLLYRPIGGSFETLYLYSLKPTTQGKVFIYLQAYLDALTTYTLPDITQVLTPANEQLVEFTIHHREVSDDNLNPAWITTEEQHVRTAIKGGIEKHKAERNNFFVNYLPTEKPFFTWQPQGRMIKPLLPIYLSAFIPQAAGKLVVQCTSIAGQVNNLEYILPAAKMVHIVFNPADAAAGLASSLLYLDFYIVDPNSSTALTQLYRYYIDYSPAYVVYSLIYHNSLGGIDFATVQGSVTHTVEKQNITADGGINKTNWQSRVKPWEQQDVMIEATKVFKGDIGWQYTKQHQEALLEILVSKSVWQLIDGRWVRVLNTQRAAELGVQQTDTMNFAIEWKLAEANEVFTPSHITLGSGVDNEVY